MLEFSTRQQSEREAEKTYHENVDVVNHLCGPLFFDNIIIETINPKLMQTKPNVKSSW
jgi:hypothetical protein